MNNIATYFDYNYLSRGLILIESLNRFTNIEFHFYILCLDQMTLEYFKDNKAPGVTTINLDEIESRYPELETAKNNRSAFEYYFTLSPILPLFILEKFKVDQVTTMDADIYFFEDPTPLFQEIKKHSISITPHNFSKDIDHLAKFGKYNVSFQSFKNDSVAVKCLLKWKNQCIDWCYDKLEPERFADQKYLDEWENEYPDLYVINIPGCGIAPWNLNRYSLSVENHSVLTDSHKLIYYHFHQLKIINDRLIRHVLPLFNVKPTHFINTRIYLPYISLLNLKRLGNDTKIERNNLSFSKAFCYFLFQNKYYFQYNNHLYHSTNFFTSIHRFIRSLLNKYG
jgi:hypothetical protein